MNSSNNAFQVPVEKCKFEEHYFYNLLEEKKTFATAKVGKMQHQ